MGVWSFVGLIAANVVAVGVFVAVVIWERREKRLRAAEDFNRDGV